MPEPMSFFAVQSEELVAAGAVVAGGLGSAGAGRGLSGALAGTPAEAAYEEFVAAASGALGSVDGAVGALSGALRGAGCAYQATENSAASKLEA
jgi:hypothetical protein